MMEVGTTIESGPWAGVTVISAYSRATAIEDGVLVDVSEMGAEAGFKVPVAVTAAVWAEIERGNGKRETHRKGRLWDVLWMASLAARRASPTSGPEAPYTVKIGRRVHRLWAHIGGGDSGEPVMTIGYPSDF